VSVRLFRFRRFSVRLLAMLLGLLIATLASLYVLVTAANDRIAFGASEANLEIGSRVYDNAVDQSIRHLRDSATVMSNDYAIRTVLLKDPPDLETLASALENYAARVGAPVIALFDANGRLLTSSRAAMPAVEQHPFIELIHRAAESDNLEAHGFSYEGDALHALVVAPLFAPRPTVAAWFGLAFPIDKAFAQKIRQTTQLEVTFVSTREGTPPRVLASTLPDDASAEVARAVSVEARGGKHIRVVDLPAERYLTLFKPQPLLGSSPVTVVLQRPLSAELAASRELKQEIFLFSLAALAVATLVALTLARGVSEPVRQLARHTRVIAKGDYERRISLDRVDELGQLADAFNSMSSGLAERDRVRDLLDKNVSPEVAAQLLRDGAALGGEEREVTILFADLRGFTSLSEKLPPRELLGLLNRYLDRMSVEIELQGGVIDKFIGDAIMALFGAPVAQSDSADRALNAALGMERALSELNATLAAERGASHSGSPNGPALSLLKGPLAFGVGINTARVVAGNIGSHRRLNYSVIGDGVNLASRLQTLTRDPVHRTNIVVSAATVRAARARYVTRPLGTVTVKGRSEPVEIFAVSSG
jgi:adenylate cyclase